MQCKRNTIVLLFQRCTHTKITQTSAANIQSFIFCQPEKNDLSCLSKRIWTTLWPATIYLSNLELSAFFISDITLVIFQSWLSFSSGSRDDNRIYSKRVWLLDVAIIERLYVGCSCYRR